MKYSMQHLRGVFDYINQTQQAAAHTARDVSPTNVGTIIINFKRSLPVNQKEMN